MDAGLAAFLGAIAGAVGAGVPQVVTALVQHNTAKAQRKHEKDERDAQRQHEKSERDAQRDHESLTNRRTARAQQIAHWRSGLNNSALTYQKWSAIYDNDKQRREAVEAGGWSPNVVSEAWFQSLRPRLPERFRNESHLHCDDQTVLEIGNEIDRIEREWNGTEQH